MKNDTVYLIGRQPDMPDHYYMEDVARDYALAIQQELGKAVYVMGISTGGQLAQYLAADHPRAVKKIVIVSSAFRLSKEGKQIEARAAHHFEQKQYGKAMAVLIELVMPEGFKRKLVKPLVQLIATLAIRNIKYPNDFLVEVRADQEMDFSERLKDIKIPALVLGGDADICYCPEDIETTARKIPQSKLIIYKGYGHDLAVSNSLQIQKDIIDFISSNP